MCGKYMKMENLLETIIGSPPHVREVLIKWNLYNNIMGITPRMCGKYTEFENI